MQSWFTIEQLKSDVYALAEFQHHELCVSYLILGKDTAYLVDSGMGYESILPPVRKLAGSRPIKLLLTHAHWDHIGSVSDFSDIFLYNHPFEMGLLEHGFSSKETPDLQDPAQFSPPFIPKYYVVPGATAFTPINEGNLFNGEVIAYHTPGHTPGSVSYYFPNQQVVACGDLLYAGPLYAHLPESNIQDYQQSLKKLIQVLPSETLILPGHNTTALPHSFLLQVHAGFTTLSEQKQVYQFENFSILT